MRKLSRGVSMALVTGWARAWDAGRASQEGAGGQAARAAEAAGGTWCSCGSAGGLDRTNWTSQSRCNHPARLRRPLRDERRCPGALGCRGRSAGPCSSRASVLTAAEQPALRVGGGSSPCCARLAGRAKMLGPRGSPTRGAALPITPATAGIERRPSAAPAAEHGANPTLWGRGGTRAPAYMALLVRVARQSELPEGGKVVKVRGPDGLPRAVGRCLPAAQHARGGLRTAQHRGAVSEGRCSQARLRRRLRPRRLARPTVTHPRAAAAAWPGLPPPRRRPMAARCCWPAPAARSTPPTPTATTWAATCEQPAGCWVQSASCRRGCRERAAWRAAW